MLAVDRHTYQVLTKRPARMARFVRMNADLFPTGEVPAHIWMGTSIEDDRVLFRADHLREVAAAVRFLSCEPLLGSLAGLRLHGIHWVIAGGESGIGHRRMEPRWVRELRELCVSEDVAFFFKQWGGRTPKAGGRELDGETWSQMPVSRGGPGPGLSRSETEIAHEVALNERRLHRLAPEVVAAFVPAEEEQVVQRHLA
jgi:protein gp37